MLFRSSGVATDQVDDLMAAGVRLSNAFGMDLRQAIMQLIKTKSGLVEETLKATGALSGLSKEQLQAGARSEERRVGKECRSRGSGEE